MTPLNKNEFQKVALNAPEFLFYKPLNLALFWSRKSGAILGFKWFFQQIGFLNIASFYHNCLHKFKDDVFLKSEGYLNNLPNIANANAVCLVRDPFARVVSSYSYAIKSNHKSNQEQQQLAKFLNRKVDSENTFTFREFVNYLESLNIKQCNSYYALQLHPFIENNAVTNIHIVHLEKCVQEFAEVEKVLSLKHAPIEQFLKSLQYQQVQYQQVQYQQESLNNTQKLLADKQCKAQDTFPSYKSFYDDDLISKVIKIYQADFNAFEYPKTFLKYYKRGFDITNLVELEQQLTEFPTKSYHPISSPKLLNEYLLLKDSKFFDASWYLKKNRNVAELEVNPILHYLIEGSKQGLNPSPGFNTSFYLQKYSDLAATGINPLIHYLCQGISEGRYPQPPPKREVLSLYLKDILKRPHIYLGKIFNWQSKIHHLPHKLATNAVNRHIKRSVNHSSYTLWISNFDTLTTIDHQNIYKHINTFAKKPLISVIIFIPHKNKWLQLAINSVFKQLYAKWELCFVCNDTIADYLKTLLNKQQNDNFKFVFCKTLEEVLAKVNGNYVTFLDLHDELAEHALYMIAYEINNYPEAQFLYSDEDTLTKKGSRKTAYFKPDWNPDLFLSHNFANNVAVFHNESLRQTITTSKSALPKIFLTWHYYLSLHFITKIPPINIRHIPHVLYHQRNITKKSDINNRLKVLQEYLDSASPTAKAEIFAPKKPLTKALFRIRYELSKVPLTSIIIVVKQINSLQKCLANLAATNYPNYEIIIVTSSKLATDKQKNLEALLHNIQIKFLTFEGNNSATKNFAAQQSKGEILCFLSESLKLINGDWLTEMVSQAVRPQIAAVGAKILYPDNTINHAGIILGVGNTVGNIHRHFPNKNQGYFYRAGLTQNFSAVSGDCLVIAKELFTTVGGFDANNLPNFLSEVDLCLHLTELGYRNLWTPHACFYKTLEDSSITENYNQFSEASTYIKSRWEGNFFHDPAYNPNLTLSSEDLQLNFGYLPTKPYNKVREDILKFIVTGHPHSGTTAISDVFRQIPKLFSGFECGFLVHDKPIDFINPESKHYPVYYESLKFSWSLMDEDIAYICKSSSWQEVYLKLRERSLKIKDKTTVLFDKTPHYTLYLDEVLDKIENNVKIVFVIRDIRAQYWAYKKRNRLNAALNFLQIFSDEYAAKLLRYRDAGKIYLLHYEDACLNTEQELKKVFDFLELDFDANYLNFTSEYKPEYGRGIESKYLLTHEKHLTAEDYRQIRSLTKNPLFYYDMSGKSYNPIEEDPYKNLTLIVIDTPQNIPTKPTFLLSGWIASLSEIEGVWVSSTNTTTELQLLERPDAAKIHKKSYPYIRGFKGEITQGFLTGNQLKLHYQLASEKFSYLHNISGS